MLVCGILNFKKILDVLLSLPFLVLCHTYHGLVNLVKDVFVGSDTLLVSS